MRRALAVLVLVILLAACGEESSRSASPRSSAAEWLRELSSPDSAARLRAVEWFGGIETPTPSVIRALVRAQRDDEEAVARAALEVLDRVGPSSPLLERIEARGPFQDIEHVMVLPSRVHWSEVQCEDVALREGEVLDACRRIVEIPPVIEARVKRFQPWPGKEISDPGDRIRHAWRLIRGPDEDGDPGSAEVPKDAPEEARVGEVWCRVLSSGASEWRRARSCE